MNRDLRLTLALPHLLSVQSAPGVHRIRLNDKRVHERKRQDNGHRDQRRELVNPISPLRPQASANSWINADTR
ncbi:hypothetical protein DFH09DRAFT_9227 [Mycena vulgaris]|nr:hypothetical protein DFH09DRAFT_9227 [Mycena vulgaris]